MTSHEEAFYWPAKHQSIRNRKSSQLLSRKETPLESENHKSLFCTMNIQAHQNEEDGCFPNFPNLSRPHGPGKCLKRRNIC